MGDRLSEVRRGFESLSVLTDEGELLEVTATDDEIVVGVNDTISAAYDRVGGFLISASFSLVGGVIDSYSRGILDLPDELFEKAVGLRVKGDDLVIVVEFDDDGEAKMFLMRTENGQAAQLVDVVNYDEMMEAYGVIEGEEDEGDEGEDDEPINFTVEGEEELVGEFLSGWRQLCPIFDFEAEFAVGIRTQVVDFSIIDAENEEAMPYHASELIDPSELDNIRLTAKMVRSFVNQAFPESGWG